MDKVLDVFKELAEKLQTALQDLVDGLEELIQGLLYKDAE